MKWSKQVEKPIIRGKLRRSLGKKYFIVKRKLRWIMRSKHFSRVRSEQRLKHSVFEHSSILLRPLKDVDMQYQHNKIQNLRLAISELDGLIIKPGETFSLWFLVGNPTKKRGYLKGLILTNGKIGYDYGGGLCQLGNLLYWMVIHSQLSVTERWRHGFDVFPDVNRKLPFGSGATLSYNYVDFQFKNNTEVDYQIHLYLTKEKLNGVLYSSEPSDVKFEVYESEHIIQSEFWGGYTRHNRLNRRMINNNSGDLISDELITENHAIMMYEPLLKEKSN